MKYRIIILAGIFGLFFSCEKETSPEQANKFMKLYGNYLMDEARDVEVLSDGGYAICGTDSTAEGGKRMVLILTDEYGNLRDGFPAYFTEDGLDAEANSMVVIRGGQGGFLLCGFVERPIEGTQATQKDIFLVKTSSTGSESWQQSYGSGEDEEVLHATERYSSGYMLAGYQVKNGKSDIMIMGVYEEGDSIELGLPPSSFAKNSAASYIITSGERYICVCTYDKFFNAGTDIRILVFDDDLAPLSENLTGNFDEFGMCALEDGPESFLVLGNRINTSGFSEMVVYLFETNGLIPGNSFPVATISEANTDLIGKRFVKTADGRYAIIGTRKVAGSSEIILQFLAPSESDFEVAERVLYGATGIQTGADIALPSNEGLVLLGTNGYEENSMISLIKTNDAGGL